MFKDIKTTPKIKKIIIFAIILVLIATAIASIILIKNHLDKKAELKQLEYERQTRINAVREAIFPIISKYCYISKPSNIQVHLSDDGDTVNGISSFRFNGASYDVLLSIAYLICKSGNIQDPINPDKVIEFSDQIFDISGDEEFVYISRDKISFDNWFFNGSKYPHPGLYRKGSYVCLCRLE